MVIVHELEGLNLRRSPTERSRTVTRGYECPQERIIEVEIRDNKGRSP